ncbi:hypothetical protein OTU49_001981 [Cherax quadricarinatus]|uniref:Uncharacterized protein n=1 Tax=Cherax quadricarinatus TaxID=27406 RepID=A0AAW0XSI3_CHEQU|nr:uncharacterized protein LOC128693180 isoform X1 [Cherax quadricarinatus]XP_053638626.1 uncharacterized protein LOC128693180 isoform X1 [Cherax quadricarinatus]XP_053638627.1 uncharacterized protein LOC128693180 isoform X1 [Cherax quadricarinatus]
MQCENEDLWGPVASLCTGLATNPLGFEDSFSPAPAESEGDSTQHSADGDYIALEDSSQYLAGLERKLASIQGRADSGRQRESRRLIDALASSRDSHTHQLMNTPNNVGIESEVMELENDRTASITAASVVPQGALCAVIRRVAPDKVALAPEELCRLLEADILGKVHEALEEEAEAPHSTTQQSRTTSVNSTINGVRSADICTLDNEDKKKNVPLAAAKTPCDHKDSSSDEGEK